MKVVCHDCGEPRKHLSERPRSIKTMWKNTVSVCKKCRNKWFKKHWVCPKCGANTIGFRRKYEDGICDNCGYCTKGHDWETNKQVLLNGNRTHTCIHCGHLEEIKEMKS